MTITRRVFHLGVLLGLACLFLLEGAPLAQARELSFDERVAAQKAIEQVYWNHRIWPKENPGPKPPLAEIMPDAVLSAKVTDYLKKSTALETWWQRPVTAAQLQAEMDRIATSTRDARLLREVFEALGNDPFLIAETLARQTLVERLIRNWYESDSRFHAAVRERAERALVGHKDTTDLKTLGGEYHETLWVRSKGPTDGTPPKDEISLDAEAWTETLAQLAERVDGRNAARPLILNRCSPLRETSDDFSVVMVMESTGDHVRVATVRWAKAGFDAWWRSQAPALGVPSKGALAAPQGGYVQPTVTESACTPDTWRSTRLEVPDPRYYHTAVWTGTEMIVWGGYTYSHLDTGGRYNPSTDTWTSTGSGPNVPAARYYHSVVWTGTEMIVWGGLNSSYLNTGGRYNPGTDTWTATSTGTNAPTARENHSAVWTGTEMIVWSGYGGSYPNTGGRYKPSTDTWTPTSIGTNVPPGRYLHTAFWTGTEMIVWGGYNENDETNTGGRYNPSNDTWTPTSIGTNVPGPRYYHSAVWTGTQMIVWGGNNGTSDINTGGRYSPSNDTWLPTSIGTNSPVARSYHTAVWTGTDMIVWGGGLLGPARNTGGRYNPSSNTWTATSTGTNVASPRFGHSAVWTGTEMIVWGGAAGSSLLNSGGRYQPSTNTWTPTSTATNMPFERTRHSAIWTGTEMIVWGGVGNVGSAGTSTGGRYSPSMDTWTTTSTGTDVPSPRSQHTAVWTGTEMIVWGGGNGGTSPTNSGGRYDPSVDTWAATSTGTDVPDPRIDHTAVWTGTEMIVWGGYDASYFNTGGRYRPSTNMWASTSTANEVPSPRTDHTAVWTGTEMIVWGGSDGSDLLNTGGRYSPSTDSWAATNSDTNVPAARNGHTAVWTGTEMIVWGGFDGSFNMNAGGRYDPEANMWTATGGGTNLPSARLNHSATWTGTQMIVWGGYDGSDRTNTGGRYGPSTDTWLPTSMGTNVPAARFNQTAVWTGTELIVWGGFPPTATGGLYCADLCAAVACDDGNGCTTDTCNQGVGCVFTDNTAACDDGIACTTGDACSGGSCLGTVGSVPGEVSSVLASKSAVTVAFDWSATAGTTAYQMLRGRVRDWPVGSNPATETCFDEILATTESDGTLPAEDDGYWYLVRAENACGSGDYGWQGLHGIPTVPRVSATCP